MTYLQNKNILITGAGSGIGKTLAICAAEVGATTILLGRDEEKLNQVYDLIVHAGYNKPAVVPFDLAKATQNMYEELSRQLENEFGVLDGLVHNAATIGSLTPIASYPIDQWHEVMQVNLNAPFMLTKYFFLMLKKAANASIIITSADSVQDKAYWGAYAVSKAGVSALANILANETMENTNIRVNSVDPVRARTRLRATVYPAEKPSNNPMPIKIIEKYMYLLSDESIGITGKHFRLGV